MVYSNHFVAFRKIIISSCTFHFNKYVDKFLSILFFHTSPYNKIEGDCAMISYEPFWNTLKKKNVTIYHLIHKNGINSNTINRIKKNASITTYTLNHLCKVLDCTVQDIISYTPDEQDEVPPT